MKINEVARAAGVSASAVRYYERRGLLTAPSRVNGIRQYTSSDIDQLALVTFYRSCGVSIDDLAMVLHANGTQGSENAHAAVAGRVAELDDVVRKSRGCNAAYARCCGANAKANATSASCTRTCTFAPFDLKSLRLSHCAGKFRLRIGRPRMRCWSAHLRVPARGRGHRSKRDKPSIDSLLFLQWGSLHLRS
ncbi:MAG: MerR family transcriptional regulator [Candidatus Eremiobacteraeota bacterium]|nr:MerR family transcriptional regulator [Candidatus Eremiobacteraeota bacterium]